CPRPLDWHGESVPIPYNHANLDSEEMIYYVHGEFSSRKGIDVGSITLHPSGVPHGPQPGLAEKSLGAERTDELAVMVDTFRPMRYTNFARALSDEDYRYSWYEPPEDADGDGSTPSIP
ncbi:MAG: homogentisate 1,2-dioxygenase domain-containing protein, partial [Nitriliruptorales bacterium]|nr:homogentisate 1,2-dioxygenase domain-containing protein [Nitriliruptorales bacterium]